MQPRAAAQPPLLVVGASARALAASGRRAGWSVLAADLFADADLQATAARTIRVPAGPGLPWPAGLESCLLDFPVAPLAYTGALENHPDLVDRLARKRPLAGNPGDRLRAIRDPAGLARAARAAGVAYPETRCDPSAVPVDGSFLVKPRASAGGHGIARWLGGTVPDGDHVWQRFVPGRPWSVAFALDCGGARVFGASRQLVGRDWCASRGHAWCGAVDLPLAAIPAVTRTLLGRLGRVLASDFGLAGLVGADLVVDPAGVVHVVEINPRPTASMELVERATGESVAGTHLAAWGLTAVAAPRPAVRPAAWAKAVVFAAAPLVMDTGVAGALAELLTRWTGDDDGWPAIADVPVTGAVIDTGRPVLTVFAAAARAPGALRRLRRRVAAVQAILCAGVVSPPVVAGRGTPARRPGSSA